MGLNKRICSVFKLHDFKEKNLPKISEAKVSKIYPSNDHQIQEGPIEFIERVFEGHLVVVSVVPISHKYDVEPVEIGLYQR